MLEDPSPNLETPLPGGAPAPDDLAFVHTLRRAGTGRLVFGRYRLLRELGAGGMAVVWLASDERLGLDVALKFLPGLVASDPEALHDLRREITRGLRLTHRGIVRLYDLQEDSSEGTAAIAMEYIDGPTLSQLKLRQPERCFEVAEPLLSWARELCEVLNYVHQKRVVHRDLKPGNLMLTAEGELKVADFGIAATLCDSHSRVTQARGSSGTPSYMSPQQAMGRTPLAADDVYAFGATLYELLTSKPPFFRGSLAIILNQVAGEIPPTMQARRAELGLAGSGAIPPHWEETIAACLAKEAADRPRSFQEIFERLRLGEASAPRREELQTMPPRATQKATLPPDDDHEGMLTANAPNFPPAHAPAPAKTAGKRPLIAALVLSSLAAAAGYAVWNQGQTHVAASAPVKTTPSSTPMAREILLAAPARSPVPAPLPVANPETQPIALATTPVPSPVVASTQEPAAIPAKPAGDAAALATREAPFVNSLGMEFVPIPGTKTLICRTHTRVRDFRAYVRATGHQQRGGASVLKIASLPGAAAARESNAHLCIIYIGPITPTPKPSRPKTAPPKRTIKAPAPVGRSKPSATPTPSRLEIKWVQDDNATWEAPGFPQGEDHPVVCVSWEEARAFCAWLSQVEGRTYRLPLDAEWTAALGLGKYPWGATWPPPGGSGNFLDETAAEKFPKSPAKVLAGYQDGYARTSPVANYAESRLTLFDMGGNAWQWCEDEYQPSLNDAETLAALMALRKDRPVGATPRILRGGSWAEASQTLLRSNVRNCDTPTARATHYGFRCTLTLPDN